MVKTKVNFFWSGENFDSTHRLCLLSHVLNNHRVIVWLHGARPKSKYWISDIPEIFIKNADEIFNIDNFIEKGGNFKTGSFLFRCHLLYKQGGWYADTDAYCCETWPNDEWCIVTGEKAGSGLISNGVIKAPPKHLIFLDCIKNVEKKWGNVRVFTEAYKRYFDHTDSTHPDKLFYPFSCKELKDERTLEKQIDIPKVFSVHLYHTVMEREKIKRYPLTLLDKMYKEVGKYFDLKE